MSYDRTVTEIPRQNVIIGTTNETVYLRDLSGNRRYWPVRLKKFDLEALARDLDQLWAEAATREAAGEGIRLNEDLWPLAAQEQAQRTAADGYVEQIQHHIGHVQHGKISVEDLCCILDVRGPARTQDHSIRLNKAMTELGWRRPNAARTVRIKGNLVSGFVIG
jgi:predicted P-loop ATPase